MSKEFEIDIPEAEEQKMDLWGEIHEELWNDEFCTLTGEALEKEVDRLTELRFLEMGGDYEND